LLAQHPAAYTESGTDFYAIDQPDDRFRCPERELSDLSAHLRTDVIWLGFQSLVDAFQFHHWRDGTHVRSLVYGCFEQERTWERVEGAPEPWEQHALFDPEFLALRLQYTDDPDERQELERIYREADVSAGSWSRPLMAASGHGTWRSTTACRGGPWRMKDEDGG
jgi:hypothetical protein